ncbi:hypothetical protein PISL3812_01769 [Talaromyces islandicus]|uniref:Uncharacterized protein n=1 Tax=Talaromyces islandicus TaxID=28573 RepID=A0A0U1LQ85_TALIS|nr:hypothetical protein PISL3812_01769 [Talaromyces islandicus]
MFEVPEAKRVRRDEILSPGSASAASTPEIPPADDTNEAFSKLGQLLAFDTFTIDTNNAQTAENPEEGGEEDEEQEFEFRLFSAPKNPKQKPEEKIDGSGVTTQKLKIRLHSPAPGDIQPGDGRFVVPFRGWQYYFTKPEVMQLPHDDEQARVEEIKRKEYEEVAVTGSQLLEWARSTQTPGCHLPWRVFHLNPNDHKVPKPPSALTMSTSEKKKKSKPGKKRRVILRSRAAAAGMTDAEKRNKKNREKKIRKRQRERERKAALGISGVGNEAVSGEE